MTPQATLPHRSAKLYLTDGGLETTLMFHDGMDLPCAAAFDLLKDDRGTAHLRAYYQRYIDLALEFGTGFMLESATWRASPDWGARLGYSEDMLARANHASIELLDALRERNHSAESPMVISGNIGPRRDAYVPERQMGADEAAEYHRPQIRALKEAGSDLITALTLPDPREAIGMVLATRSEGIPVVISFTVETDGRLPDGLTLGEAIATVDAATGNGPEYYMINCAHPTHFDEALGNGEAWVERIRGIRANASCKSHAELDESETLDDGDPEELAQQYRSLRDSLPHLGVLGGCCGTDHRHIEAIARSCSA